MIPSICKDSAPIKSSDGSWIFQGFKGRVEGQDTKVSFDYKPAKSVPATFQPVDGMNYLLVVSRNTPERVLIEIVNSLSEAPSIVALDLTDCVGVTNNVLKALGKSKLLDIRLSNCPNFDDDGLTYLAKSKHVRQIALYGDDNIKGDGLRKVLKECKTLDALGIDRTGLEPDAVQQLHTEYHGKVKLHHDLIKCKCSN